MMIRSDAGEEELARERQRWEERWEELNVQRSVEEFEQDADARATIAEAIANNEPPF
jgi:hypothetical protein